MTEKNQRETYFVELMCHNCGCVSRHNILYGIEWKNGTKCPNCGCGSENLERV